MTSKRDAANRLDHAAEIMRPVGTYCYHDLNNEELAFWADRLFNELQELAQAIAEQED